MPHKTSKTRPIKSGKLSAAPRRVISRASTVDAATPRKRHWSQFPSGFSWRFLVIAAILCLSLYLIGQLGSLIAQLQLIFVALFIAIVFTAVLRPVADVLHHVMPRPIAVVVSILVAMGVVAGIVTFITMSVAGQWEALSAQVVDGVNTILNWVETGPLRLNTADMSGWFNKAVSDLQTTVPTFLKDNGLSIASQAAGWVGVVVQIFTGLVLAIFCSVFFINSGARIWTWFLNQVPETSRDRWNLAGNAAWRSFAGYTRGIFLVAASNGLFAGIGLALFDVPLAAPLGVLVFIGTFIPLIGSPTAMVLASIVALATRGPVIALIVMGMIVLIGQFEGNVLQPLIMSKQTELHPVVVALSVAGGTLLAGVIGAIVAVPVVSVAWSVFSTLRRNRLGIKEEEEPPKKKRAILRRIGIDSAKIS